MIDVAAFSVGPLQAGLISIPSILTAAVVLLVAFVLWEARQEEPLLPLSLFADRNFSAANGVSIVITFAMFGLFLPLTIFLQSVLGLDALHAGFVFVPMSLTSTFIAPFAGRFSDRVGGKWLLTSGLTLFAIGMGLVVAASSLSTTGLSFTLPLMIAGIGMGLTFAPLTTVAMRNIPQIQAGAASGFLNTTRQVGGAIGSAVVGAVLQHRLASELHIQAVKFAASARPPLPSRAAQAFISGFSHSKGGLEVGRGQTGTGTVPTNLPAGLQAQLHNLGVQVFHHAFLLAMKPSLAIAIVALLLGAVTTLLIRSSRSMQSTGSERPAGVAVAGE
jgi:MFS family permease